MVVVRKSYATVGIFTGDKCARLVDIELPLTTMLKRNVLIAVAALAAFGAVPAGAQTSTSVDELSTVPARTLNPPPAFVINSRNVTRDLNTEERRFQKPPQRFELRKVKSPLQSLPRGNQESALLGDQPDTVILTDIVEW